MRKIFFGLVILNVIISCSDKSSDPDLKLWYNQPAASWNEALPIGNGRLGAMIFGDPVQEHLQLNEETVWAGGPHNNVNPESAEYLVKVRDLIFQGKYADAQQMANEHITSYQNGMPYQPVGDCYISFPDHENYTDYYRDLNIKKATASVSYMVDGIKYSRDFIASFTDQVIIARFSADKPGCISFDMSVTSPQKHKITIADDQLMMSGITTDHEGIPGQVEFVSIIKPVIRNGSISQSDTVLSVTAADEVILYISTGTNFVNYHDITTGAAERAEKYLQQALQQDYMDALESHVAYYQNYFSRVTLDLGTTDSVKNPTDIRLSRFRSGNDPQLVTLYFQFGRYLLISSSQPGGQPANLQGIWNDRLYPPWESKYTININTEMNYWPAEVTNLSELNEPLFRMIKELSVTGREAASKLYGARGWVTHHNTDIWRVTGIFDLAFYGLWQSGSNWLSQHLWQHFLFSGDTAFLREYYPVMKSAAEFYSDVLVEEPVKGWLVFCPSNSPENRYLGVASASAGTTMDNQLLLDLFSNVINAAGILDMDNDFADTLRQLRERLAPMQIGQYGQLQEWLYDWDDPNDHHRHVSHLYGLYPGSQISPYRHPQLFQAARTSLQYRGDESTGWSMGWKVNLWARLLDGNHAFKLITDQLTPAILPDGSEKGGTYPNLLDAHPPFQIDGNFGCIAGIAEMLVQSHDECIFILPALPERWTDGKVTGLKARGGFEVNMEWAGGKIKSFTIYSGLGANCRIRIKDEIQSAENISLIPAEGINPNPFFSVNPVKDPVISSKAIIEEPVLPVTYIYDFQTEKGRSYTFRIAE
jgi:alpha-L-fucosidase 2